MTLPRTPEYFAARRDYVRDLEPGETPDEAFMRRVRAVVRMAELEYELDNVPAREETPAPKAGASVDQGDCPSRVQRSA